MKVLILALEGVTWGPARLPKVLQEAGFQVAALCRAGNPLAATRYIDRRFDLPASASSHRLAPALYIALRSWRPDFVIPADEHAVALLHALLRDIEIGNALCWPADMVWVLQRSMGLPAQRDSMLFKNRIQELARSIDVLVPAGDRVGSQAEAATLAHKLGYPVVLKKSFSNGGDGVKVCDTPEQLSAAFAAMAPVRPGPLKHCFRSLVGRGWFPVPRQLWVQQRIVGVPAMYTLVAFEGRVLAGFAGLKRNTSSPTGPSTVVEFGPCPELVEPAARMTEALGATGFISFDFMIEAASGKPYLLECNARPNQVPHLGRHLGVDLCAALMDALQGMPSADDTDRFATTRSETIALFPQEWLRASDSPYLTSCYHDVPWDDEPLLAGMTAAVCKAHSAAPNNEVAFNFMKLAKGPL